MTYLKVEGHSGLYRDPKTNSIVNRNNSEYNEYMSRKKIKDNEKNSPFKNFLCPCLVNFGCQNFRGYTDQHITNFQW